MSITGRHFDTLTVKPKKRNQTTDPNQMTLDMFINQGQSAALEGEPNTSTSISQADHVAETPEWRNYADASHGGSPEAAITESQQTATESNHETESEITVSAAAIGKSDQNDSHTPVENEPEDLFDREAVMNKGKALLH